MTDRRKKTDSIRPQNEREGRKQRRTPRRVFSRPIGVLHQGEYEVVLASQLSEGGIGFFSSKKMASNDLVVISLVMPSGGVVVGRGQILQSKSQEESRDGALHYGVKFIAMSLPLRRLIRNYVTAKTQAEAEKEAESHKQKDDAA